MVMQLYFLPIFIAAISAQVSLSPWSWATIATSASDSNRINKTLDFFLPDTLNDNVTQAVLLGFRSETDRLYIFDIDHNTTYSTDIADAREINWVIQDRFDVLSTCLTSKCFTQIEDELYIWFDASDRFIIYNLVHESEFTIRFDDEYAGVYCLTNNGTHIFAVGTNPNIVIYEVDTDTFSFSADFVPNGQTLACAMASDQNVIYIFGEYGVLKYAFVSDTLSTKYGREYALPFFNQSDSDTIGQSHFLTSVASFTATDAHASTGLIWIKRNAYVYAYSSVTDKLLNCRVQHSEADVVGSTLFLVDDVLLDFGGAIADDSEGGTALSATDRITLIDTSFLDDRFRLSDWYYPSHPIAINYTRGYVQTLVDQDVTHVQMDLSSLDFSVGSIAINLLNLNLIVSGTTDECEVCYDGASVGECGAVGGYCLQDGLRVDLTASAMNAAEVDVSSVSYSIEVHSNVSDIASSASSGFVCNSFPIYPVYLSLTARLFSDDDFFLNFEYAYECSGCAVANFNDSALYDFESTVVLNAASLGIEENVTMTILNQQSCLITSGVDVYNCSHFRLPFLAQVYFQGIYQFELFSSDTFLAADTLQMTLSPTQTKCAAGTGYDASSQSCSKCAKDSFSLRADLSSCISCGGVEGVACSGGSDITVDYRYWVSGYDLERDAYVTLFEMDDTTQHVLIAHICAFGQCCQLDEGCDYVSEFDGGAILCSRQRDMTTAMCTACNDGYYELLSTNDCGECDFYDNMWYLLGVFTIAFILVFYLAFCDAKPADIMIDKVKKRESRKENDDEDGAGDDDGDDDDDFGDDNRGSESASLSSSDDDQDDDVARGMKKSKKKKHQKQDGRTAGLKKPRSKQRKLSHVEQQQRARDEKRSKVRIDFSYFVADSYIANSALLFQIFVYYFQGYAEVLSSAGTRAYLSPIVNFFNFNFANDQIGSNDDGNNGFCAIPFTDALGEILIALIFPGMMLFSLLLISIFCNRGCGNNYYTKPYVVISFFRIWIIIVGLLFRALMQMITCTDFFKDDGDLDPHWVHFFFEDACYGAAWWVALFALVILLLVFAGFYIKLFQQSKEDRYALRNPFTKLVQAYKPKYWYWEAVNTSRRFMITMFVTLSFIGRGYSNLVLCLLLLFYLIAHLTIYPFKHRRNNRIETFCILSLLIGFIGINFEDIANSIFLSLFLGVVVFLPIFISLYYFIKMCLSCKAYYDGNDEHFLDSSMHGTYDEKISAIKTRVLAKRDTVFFKTRHSDLDVTAPDPVSKKRSNTAKDIEVTTLRFNHGGGKDGPRDTASGYARGQKNQSNGHESDSSCGLSE